MRIRILRDISLSGSPGIRWASGSVAEVTTEIAFRWITQGVAREDKAVEPTENKGDSKLQKIREQTRERVTRFREKKAQNVTK